MSQIRRPDLDGGSHSAGGYRDHLSTAPNQSSQSLQGDSNFGDSSGPLFSMYSKIAEEEDDKMADRWQKDADGILIFTGLFSAAVATLLSVSVQDLMPNSQDTSAFYLRNIYELFADANLTIPRSSASSPVAVPPPFSPPRYSIWVNSLWFLSLVISLTCALLATLVHQWARRYVRFTQPPRCSPEKRARMRAFFAYGMENMHFSWAVEALPALLHLSVFLFFSGLLVFLFNINQSIFSCVIWWIGLFSIVYGWVTVMPIFRYDSPYHAPLSSIAWVLHFTSLYSLVTILKTITSYVNFSYHTRRRFDDLRKHYRAGMLGGVLKAAEETASIRSSEIDFRILDWIIGALGEDDALEKFFVAIPGFLNSQLVRVLEIDFPHTVSNKFREVLGGFLRRTLSSNSVFDSVKIRRLNICLNSDDVVPREYHDPELPYLILLGRLGPIPLSIDTGHVLARWCTSKDQLLSWHARYRVAKILTSVRECDGRWMALAKDQLGLPERVLERYVAHGDSLSLAILIHMTRLVIRSGSWTQIFLSPLSKFNVHDTLPELQRDFCTLWNEIVLEVKDKGAYSTSIGVLRDIRHVYIALHQGTHPAPTVFTNDGHPILLEPSSYPFCDIASHHPDSTTHPPVTTSPTDPPIQSGPSPDLDPVCIATHNLGRCSVSSFGLLASLREHVQASCATRDTIGILSPANPIPRSIRYHSTKKRGNNRRSTL